MQNVFALPQANVSSFFYKRKLNVYQLTGHCSIGKQSYGVLWPESLSGRTGNDIASALMKILERITEDNPEVTEMVLWSDSCVPQNRNKVMSTAIGHFLQNHPTLTSVTQKFCEPGHSEVQEVDNLHSQLEKVMRVSEVYSPVGLVRILSRTPRNKPLKQIQLKLQDCKDYHSEANRFKYDTIPFTKVKTLRYSSQAPMCVYYKMRFSDESWVKEHLKINTSNRRQDTGGHGVDHFIMPQCSTKLEFLTTEKIKDIQSMLDFMPQSDRLYMETICRQSQQADRFTMEEKSDITITSKNRKRSAEAMGKPEDGNTFLKKKCLAGRMVEPQGNKHRGKLRAALATNHEDTNSTRKAKRAVTEAVKPDNSRTDIKRKSPAAQHENTKKNKEDKHAVAVKQGNCKIGIKRKSPSAQHENTKKNKEEKHAVAVKPDNSNTGIKRKCPAVKPDNSKTGIKRKSPAAQHENTKKNKEDKHGVAVKPDNSKTDIKRKSPAAQHENTNKNKEEKHAVAVKPDNSNTGIKRKSPAVKPDNSNTGIKRKSPAAQHENTKKNKEDKHAVAVKQGNSKTSFKRKSQTGVTTLAGKHDDTSKKTN